MKLLLTTLLILLICQHTLAQNYAKRTIQTISSHNYNRKKNTTTYSVIPYGQATLPGKWKEGRFADVSNEQHFLRTADSLSLAMAFYSATKLPFYTKGLEGNALAQKFYEWETQYQQSELHMQTELLEADTLNGFIMWRVYTNAGLRCIQLIGTKECKCRDVAYQLYTIYSHKDIPMSDLAAFVKQVYLGG